MIRIYHDDVWTCRRYLDCLLYSRCFLQIHKDYDACAPYPGPPNYQVPAKLMLAAVIRVDEYDIISIYPYSAEEMLEN